MWLTSLIAMALCLIALRAFLIVHNQYALVIAGLVAATGLMVALSVSPLILKLVLLLSVFGFEQWFSHRSPAIEG